MRGRPWEGHVQTWLKHERGQGLVEYGLIIFLVAVVIIALLVLLGPQIGSIFSGITGSIQGSLGSPGADCGPPPGLAGPGQGPPGGLPGPGGPPGCR